MDNFLKREEILSFPESFLIELWNILGNNEYYLKLKEHLNNTALNIVDEELDCQITIHSQEELKNIKEVLSSIKKELSSDYHIA